MPACAARGRRDHARTPAENRASVMYVTLRRRRPSHPCEPPVPGRSRGPRRICSWRKAAMASFHAAMTADPVPSPTDLKVFQPPNPYVALGLAVSHLMTKPAFAKLRFGDWSRILTGQINRKHYCFAIDGNNQVQGFMGWALTSKEKAEAWVEGRGAVSFGDSQDGDCVIINAWAASTPEANRFLV